MIFIPTSVEEQNIEENALRKARFWQGFQSLSNSALSLGAGKVGHIQFFGSVPLLDLRLTTFFFLFKLVGKSFYWKDIKGKNGVQWT